MSVFVSAAQDAAAVEGEQEGAPVAACGAARTSSTTPSVGYVCAKRCLDMVVASASIIVTLPLFVLVSALILLDDGWPVFYRQERVGVRARFRGGRVHWEERRFRIFKFRTMVRGADSVPVHEHFVEAFVNGERDLEETGFKLEHDTRITRVGRLLRSCSLDELPQLLNVLGGTMTLVGPRPVPPYEVALYEPRHRERLGALPGITGTWQVEGRGRVSFEEMVRLDIDYVRKQSLWLDVSILARTLPAVLTRQGAK